MVADAMATNDRAIGPQGGTAFHKGGAKFVFTRHGRPGIHDVGEYGAGAAEHIIFEGHPLVNRNVVLDAYV